MTDKLINDAISKEGGTIKKNDLDINHLAHLTRIFLKKKDMRKDPHAELEQDYLLIRQHEVCNTVEATWFDSVRSGAAL
ncbi:Uncharacterised protein [Yersinia pekkanenii]|uniref:Uncharacterized protein n=1 Tax=Yersinia pekkanenii TaxID=1288385 RepID=A0A0T9Q8L7_9GAMM|nr:Uncharacterised protein [Yersinia pekkanenii]CRY63584.1 Uncharacterised protein [Yersinia pekkanenii]